MADFGWWLARLAGRLLLGWVGVVVLTGGPLPRWLWRLIEEDPDAICRPAR